MLPPWVSRVIGSLYALFQGFAIFLDKVKIFVNFRLTLLSCLCIVQYIDNVVNKRSSK